jgi:hypothetical protein
MTAQRSTVADRRYRQNGTRHACLYSILRLSPLSGAPADFRLCRAFDAPRVGVAYSRLSQFRVQHAPKLSKQISDQMRPRDS